MKESKLMHKWLGKVNQPVADYVNEQVNKLLNEISDGDNFTFEETKQILIEWVQLHPKKSFKRWLKERKRGQ